MGEGVNNWEWCREWMKMWLKQPEKCLGRREKIKMKIKIFKSTESIFIKFKIY